MNTKIEVLGMGFNNSGYPGAFTPVVQGIIKSHIYGKVLHLYSGSSLIGDERIDIEHPNATKKMKVEEFIQNDTRLWDWAILDPPYAITRTDAKLNGYGIKGSVSANVTMRRLLKSYLQTHTCNVFYLDYCAPMIKGFQREYLWLLLPGGFHNVRILSWLKKHTERLL
jgi:hypothetical protein